MLDDKTKLDLSPQEFELISQALQTQEKIWKVESRAGTNNARTRLAELKGLMRRLNRSNRAKIKIADRGWFKQVREFFLMLLCPMRGA